MKLLKTTLVFTTLALAVASAADYKFNLSLPMQAGSTQLKPGEYKVSVEGDKAIFKRGKETVAEVPATLEKNTQKYSVTSFESSDSKLKELHIGGTDVKITLKTAANSGVQAGN